MVPRDGNNFLRSRIYPIAERLGIPKRLVTFQVMRRTLGTDLQQLRIPVMWAGDSGDAGRRRSEATLVAFYSSQVAHMSQEKGK